MNKIQDWSEVHLDALQEISNIGMGNAITSLARLVNERINMDVPKARFMPFEETIELIGGHEKIICCVCIRLIGEIPGIVLFIFDEESTFKLVDMIMCQDLGFTGEMDEMGKSGVMEIGNVLTGSFINAIYTMTSLNIQPAVPMFAYDMLGAVLTSLMVASGRVEDQVLVIETRLFQEGGSADIYGHFFMFTEPGSIEKLFERLGLSL